jgi:uncharacterized protein YjbI with pentapeptide repeats
MACLTLKKLTLKRVILRGKHLGADLAGADLEEANLQDADFYGADLREANSYETVNLSLDQISHVKTLHDTKLDEELLESLKEKYPTLFEVPVLQVIKDQEL